MSLETIAIVTVKLRPRARKPWTFASARGFAAAQGWRNIDGAERLERWALARDQKIRRERLTGRPGGAKVKA